MSERQYPLEVLPREGWPLSIDTENIITTSPGTLMGRLLVGNYGSCFDTSLGDDMVCISSKVLRSSDIPNLSCSLLGAMFKPEHFHFLPKGENRLTWQGESWKDRKLEENIDFAYYSDIEIVAWCIKEVHGYPIKYKRTFSKKSDYDVFKETLEKERYPQLHLNAWEKLMTNPENTNARIVEVEGNARVNHNPTRLNYWHFTIDLYPTSNDIKPLKKASDGWRQNMANNLLDYLQRTFIIIDEKCAIPNFTFDIEVRGSIKYK